MRTAANGKYHWRLVLVTALLAACALAAFATPVARIRALRGRKGAGPGSAVADNHPSYSALFALWKGRKQCDTVDPEVLRLRAQTWPRPDAGPAPKVTEITYINVEWDPVRRNYMEEQLHDLQERWLQEEGTFLRWRRLPGVDANHMQFGATYESWREKGFSQTDYPYVDGRWPIAGTSFSHYSAIRRVSEMREKLIANNELLMIVEDDVTIRPNFPKLWEAVWPSVPEDWDILRVGWYGDYHNCTQVVNDHVDVAAWRDAPGPRGPCMYCGAHAYVVNPVNVDRVLRRFENSKMTYADELLGAPTPPLEDPSLVPPLQSFVATPLLAHPRFTKRGAVYFPSDWRRRARDFTEEEPLAPPRPPPILLEPVDESFADPQQGIGASEPSSFPAAPALLSAGRANASRTPQLPPVILTQDANIL